MARNFEDQYFHDSLATQYFTEKIFTNTSSLKTTHAHA